MYQPLKKRALFKWAVSSRPPRQRGPDSFTQRVRVTGLAVLALGTLSVVQAADMLPAPSGISPCGDTITVTSPEFVWDYSGEAADTYRIRVSTDAGFSAFDEAAADSSCGGDGCWTDVTSSPSYSGFSFEPGTYHWEARAGIKYKSEEDKGKGGSWSSTCSFTIGEAPEEEEEEEPNEEPELEDRASQAYPAEVGDGAAVEFLCFWRDKENDTLFDAKAKYGNEEVTLDEPKKVNRGGLVKFTKIVAVKRNDENPHKLQCEVSDKDVSGKVLHPGQQWQKAVRTLTINEQTLPNRPRLKIEEADNHIPANEEYTIKLRASDEDFDVHRIEVDWTGNEGKDG
jgi:hypothetical protein